MISRVFVMTIGLGKTIITTHTFANSEDKWKLVAAHSSAVLHR
jgi:hypothetical protein